MKKAPCLHVHVINIPVFFFSQWEGDNYLLTQQTTRYLLKTFRAVRTGAQGRPTFSSSYMQEYLGQPTAKCPASQPSDWTNPEVLLSTFKYRVAFLVDKAVQAIDVHQQTWNDMLVEVYRISRAHCQLLLVANFFGAVFGKDKQSNEDKVLQRLAILFALSTLESEMADVLTCGYVSPDQALLVKKQTIAALKEIRPDAVALVDVFGYPDYLMQSALGDKDGRAYERMTEMAELEPLNQTTVADGYEEYIRPLVHAGQGAWKVGKDGAARL